MTPDGAGLIVVTATLPDLDPAARTVRERWRARSLASAWLTGDDWYHPAVDALAELALEGPPLDAAAERLGTARARSGVGVGEAFDDLTCLFAAVRSAAPVPDDAQRAALRALAVGWSHGDDVPAGAGALVDPCSGLPTLEYLRVRLREVYGAAARRGRSASATHALVVVDVAVERLTVFQRVARSAAMGAALQQVFGEDAPAARVGPGVYVALCPRDDDLALHAAQVRRAVDATARRATTSAVLRRPPRVWVEPLPSSAAELDALLDHLGGYWPDGAASV